MKCVSLLLFITIFGGIFRHGRSTCVLESDFGFILNCAFKKSGLFRVRNLGGVKAHIGLGFSVGDELGFKESISNTEINRRRSAQVSKMQAQLIQATQKQQDQKKAKFVNQDKVVSSRSVSSLPVPSVESVPVTSMKLVTPLSAGTVRHSSEAAGEIPPFKPIPPAAERPSITKSSAPQSALMGIAFPSFNTMPSSISRFSVGTPSKLPVDPSIAKVMAVVAVPKKKIISQITSDRATSGFADRLLSVGNHEVDKPVPQHSSNSLQSLLSANNLTEEALELALLQRQQMINKLKSKTTTTTTSTTTTRRPVTSRYANSVGKVMNAPKEYYPVGYDKNFDDNFAARVELPETSFYCEHQKHFPGLYADEDLGCMGSEMMLSEPDPRKAAWLLDRGRRELSGLTGIRTGHCRLKRHLSLLGIEADSTCRRCGVEEETSFHFLAECEALGRLRYNIFGVASIALDQLQELNWAKVLSVVRGSGWPDEQDEVFHVCALTDDGLIMKSFLCPESTLYDQSVLRCNWWFYVDCKNSKKLYDSNIPISKSYQLMKALTFFSAYKKESASTTTPKSSED